MIHFVIRNIFCDESSLNIKLAKDLLGGQLSINDIKQIKKDVVNFYTDIEPLSLCDLLETQLQ